MELNIHELREYEWWRQAFQCRFGPHNLPRPGDPILGYRFVLFYEGMNGELIKYHDGRKR